MYRPSNDGLRTSWTGAVSLAKGTIHTGNRFQVGFDPQQLCRSKPLATHGPGVPALGPFRLGARTYEISHPAFCAAASKRGQIGRENLQREGKSCLVWQLE
jgi:hypothetical protein